MHGGGEWGRGVQKNPQILSKIVQLYGIYDFFSKVILLSTLYQWNVSLRDNDFDTLEVLMKHFSLDRPLLSLSIYRYLREKKRASFSCLWMSKDNVH